MTITDLRHLQLTVICELNSCTVPMPPWKHFQKVQGRKDGALKSPYEKPSENCKQLGSSAYSVPALI